MEELKRKLFQREVSNLLLIYSEEKAYELFIEFINEFHGSLNEYDSKELDDIFPKPHSFTSLNKNEINEFGDINTNSEYTDADDYPSFEELKEFGWLNDDEIKSKIINNKFYQEIVFKSIGDMPFDVKQEIQLHATHILGRCNNPNNWGENIQGLVYGMVQSGKTASMMTLMGLAKSSGYRIFIVLSGDKDSLRNQTQRRINESFNLNKAGYSKNHINNVRSITTLKNDYTLATNGIFNGIEAWDLRDPNECIIICIKKQKDNLDRLLKHLQEIEEACNEDRIYNHHFANDFKTMILDDEADFSSQDTSNKVEGSTIHNLLCQIRETLKQNCYVAYTATPQACIGANPEKLIGYPKDFIWLLEPHKLRNGETSSYLGLEEFFEKFPNQLITLISRNAWPHIVKEEGKKMGIHVPSLNNTIVTTEKLYKIEFEHLDNLIHKELERNEFCKEFKIAMTDFLIGCSIRWYRHYIKCKSSNYFSDSLPSLENIEEIEKIDEEHTRHGFKPFPYHSMMFNLSYINENQNLIITLIDLLWKDIKVSLKNIKSNKWTDENNLFLKGYQNQLEKSKRFELSIPSPLDLEPFIDIATKITGKSIPGDLSSKYIYLINSSIDEGMILRYDAETKEARPKKAAIIVGGHTLSRGLTIENLSTTIFVRSQVMSLGDTNLQMCRWFGHKKNSIDLQSVYMQNHTFELFQNISQADNQLRHQFRYHINKNIPNKCLLLQLYNSPLFKITSPSKMRDSSSLNPSYSGITVDLLQHIKHEDFLSNSDLLESYIESLPENLKGCPEHNRALVYRDVPVDEFLIFFESLKIADDSLNITPKTYLKYLQKWRNDHPRDFPKFNVAIFDNQSNGEYRERARKLNGVNDEFKSEEEFKNAATSSLKAFRGGKSTKESQKRYCGDFLIDFSEKFHSINYETKNLRRPSNSAILFIFYRLKANYVGKFKDKLVYFEKKDKLFIDIKENKPVITFSIATPLGGPVFTSRINNKVFKLVSENKVECEKHYDSEYDD